MNGQESGNDQLFGVILERIGEVRDDVKDLREDQRATTAAVASFGVRLTGVEQRFDMHQRVCDEKFGHRAAVRMRKLSERLERFATRLRELGGQVDGQEITQRTSIAALEAERRMKAAAERRKELVAKIVMWSAGAVISISLAVIGWVFFLK